MTGFLARIHRRALLAVLSAAAAALVAASVGSSAPPTLKQKEAQKEAQAKSVLAQVAALQVQMGRLDEAYNGARYRLEAIEASKRRNAVALGRAKQGYRVAVRRAEQRLVTIYEAGEPSTADALLGAANLNDMLNRIEAVDSVSTLDRQIADQVSLFRDELSARAKALAIARRQQAQTVTDLATERQQHKQALGHYNALLASIHTQVASMRQQERVQQQRLLEEARVRLARLERQRAAEAAAAAAQQRAQEKAAAAAAAAVPVTTNAAPPATTTTAVTTTAVTTTAVATTATTTAVPTTDGTTTTAVPPPPTTTDPATTTTPAANPTPPVAGGHPEAATIALQYLGVPYLWGGGTPSGFDCSGLVMYVYAQLGVSLPHFAAAQYGFGSPVDQSDLQPGDLVFFDNLNHVGIWIGGNQFVDAPQTGDVVKIETLTGWYANNYVGARRV